MKVLLSPKDWSGVLPIENVLFGWGVALVVLGGLGVAGAQVLSRCKHFSTNSAIICFRVVILLYIIIYYKLF